MLEPLDCDKIIREHQKAQADAYFHQLYMYFRWRPWEYDYAAALRETAGGGEVVEDGVQEALL
jgi:hypothetical protein